MRIFVATALALLVLSTSGCPEDTRHPNPHITDQAPPPPPRVNVPLDPALAAAADNELAESLKANDPILRAHALEAIRNCNRTKFEPEILSALKDPRSEVRFAAALTTGELKLRSAHNILLTMAEDRSENVRVAVRYALHRLGDTHLSHDLEKMSQDSDPRVRSNVALVLGMLGEPSGFNILRVLRTDPFPPVRQQASEAMWRLGDEDALSDLIALSVSKFVDDQMIAYVALAQPGAIRVRQHVRLGLTSEYQGQNHPEVALVAARAMGMLGSDEGYAIALKGAQSTDAIQRMQAAFALGAIGRSDAQDTLRKLLTDSNESVRIAAAQAVLQLKG